MWNSSVFPNTCAWEQKESNKTETEEEGEKRNVNWKEAQRIEKNMSRRPNCSSGLPSAKKWLNYPTNLTYTYNQSTTLCGGFFFLTESPEAHFLIRYKLVNLEEFSPRCYYWRSENHINFQRTIQYDPCDQQMCQFNNPVLQI